MSTNIAKRSADTAIQTLILDAMVEDGAVCDPLSKVYDEAATLKGGNADRMTFTNYNEIITNYHKVLKVITGEVRANIYESIPVIDFLHPENTGFDKRYVIDENGTFSAASILPIEPIAKGKTAEDYIEEEDPYTINRIINNEETAELLFNTAGGVAEDPNIQVSPYIKGITKKHRQYMGVEVREYLEDIKSEYKSIRKPELSFFSFEAMDVENYEGETAEKYGYHIDDYRLDPDESLDESSNEIKNFVTLYIDDGISLSHPSHPMQVIKYTNDKGETITPTGVHLLEASSKNKNGLPFVKVSSAQNSTGKTIKKYEVTLNPKDMYLIIPGENTREETGIAVIYKYYEKDNLVVSCVPGTQYAFYVLPINDFAYNPDKSNIENFRYGDSLPEKLFLDSESTFDILKKYIEIKERYCSSASGLLSGFFSYPLKKEVVSSLENSVKVSNWVYANDYIKAKNIYKTEILPGTKYFPGHILGRGRFYEKPLAPTFHDYIPMTQTYNAPGEPHTPSLEEPYGKFGKIKSIKGNDLYIPLGEEVYRYNNTEKRFEIETDKNKIFASAASLYKLPENTLGKASILKDVIDENLKNLSSFKGVSLPKDEWIKKYADKALIKVTDVISKVDYSGEEISNRRINALQLTDNNWTDNTSGTHVLNNVLPFKNKFRTANNREAAGPDDFENYFNTLISSSHPDSGNNRIVKRGNDTILYLSSNDAAVCADIDKLSENGHIFPGKSWETSYEDGNRLKTSFNKSFYFKARHFRNKWRWDKNYGSWKGFRGGLRGFDIVSPIQTLVPKDSSGDRKVVLVYPEYPDIFPDKMFLVSSVNLDIQEMSSGKGGMISFFTPKISWLNYFGFPSSDGKLISFGVSKVRKFEPSKVNKICVYDAKNGLKTTIDRYRTDWESHTITVPTGPKRVYSTHRPNTYWDSTISNVTTVLNPPDFSEPDAGFAGNRTVKGYYYDIETYRTETKWTPITIDDFPQLSSNLDCYIYELCPLNVSLDGRYFYNQNDEKFDLMSGPGSFIFNPLTYPSKSYFPIIQKEIKIANSNGTETINVVKEGHRRDLRNIKGSIIIPSIPQFNDPEELSQIKMGTRWFFHLDNISLKVFRNMINSEILAKTSVLNNRLILSTLKPWKISSGNPDAKKDNPIRLAQLPDLLTGLSSLEPCLRSIRNTNFEIEKYKRSENGVYSIPYRDVITKEDLAPLYNRITRIENFENFQEKEYNLNELQSYTFPEVSEEDFLTSNFKTTLSDYTQAALGDGNSQVSVIPIRTFSMRRDALDSSANLFERLFNSDVEISRATCELLDGYFGLHSGAILRIGSGKTETEDIKTVDILYKKVINRFENVIKIADSEFKKVYNNYAGKSAEILINSIKTKEQDQIKKFFEEEKLSYNNEKEALRTALYSIEDFDGSIGSHGFLFDTFLQQPPNPKETTISFIPTTSQNIKNVAEEIKKRTILFRGSLPTETEKDEGEKTAAERAVENQILEITNNAIITAIERQEENIGEYASKPILSLIRDLSFSNPADLEKLDNKNKTEEEKEKIRVMRILLEEVSNILKEHVKNEEAEIKEEYERFLKDTQEPTEEGSFSRYLSKYHPGINQGTPEDLPLLAEDKIKKYVEENLILDINYKKPSNESSFEDKDNDKEPTLTTPSIAPSFTLITPVYKSLEDGSLDYTEIIPLNKEEALEIGKETNEIKINSPSIDILPIDTTENILDGLSKFIETSLEGTNPHKEGNQKYVEYTAKDQELKGRPNGLYYKRYQILNSRLHKAKGPLSRISIIKEGLKNKAFTNDNFEQNVKESYEGAIRAVNIEKAGELTYMPENGIPNVDPSVHIPGKYYYPAEITAIKKQIGDQCILTCTKCAVKNSCPYYNEDTLIKANLTPATTIDLWFKDNKLDLLYYNGEEDDRTLGEKQVELRSAKLAVTEAQKSLKDVQDKIAEKEKEVTLLNEKLINDPEIERCLLRSNVASKNLTLEYYKESETEARNKLKEKEDEVIDIQNNIKNIKDTKISPNLYLKGDPYETSINKNAFKRVHYSYADIIRVNSTDYEKLIPLDAEKFVTEDGREIQGIKQRLEKTFNNKEKYVDINFDAKRDTLGFLIGGRYGTVELNPTKALFINDNPNLKNLPNYNFLYDAIHILDEETEFDYAKSAYKYKVNLTRYTDDGEEEHFEGNTYIQVPISLKLLSNAYDNDDVYLVSDDIEDENGQPIEPVIYLGKAQNVKKLCTFDLMEGTVKDTLGAQSFVDSNNYYDFYPSDVAQWCVNYLKGNLIGHPLNTSNAKTIVTTKTNTTSKSEESQESENKEVQTKNVNVLRDLNENRDQFWMPTIKKAVYKIKDGQKRKEWYSMPGRPRSEAKYQEPVMNPDKMNANLVLSGKPVVTSYINFIRRMSIQMYDPSLNGGKGDWTIPWVNPKLPYDYKDSLDQTLDLAAIAEYKRKILPLMHTNLRLVLVVSDE